MRSFKNELESSFSFLTDFGFNIYFPQNGEMGDIIAVFTCPSFQMRLVLYHQEIYLEFSKNINECKGENSWISSHWIIEYLSGNKKYKTNFYKNVKNYDDKIKKQILLFSKELRFYIEIIIDLFDSKDNEEQYIKFQNYTYKRLKDYGLL
jgi:hypothetical protein